jgi:glycosyltransferase involved in cell wall biosynthesis
VLGDGPLRSGLERTAPRGVEFLGPRPPSEVPEILRRARALLLPSRSYEANPRTIVEAYALGVPVAGSRLGGVAEAVEDGVSGLLVQPDDAPGWVRAIERLRADGESDRLGRGARQLWSERFSPERGLASLEEAYAAAVSASRGQGVDPAALHAQPPPRVEEAWPR